MFADYVGAVLNSLMYLLKDSLERLADIHDLEAAMANTAMWDAQQPRSALPDPAAGWKGHRAATQAGNLVDPAPPAAT